MKFKLHSNPILKDLANMAVLALKFYIPSQSRTPLPRFLKREQQKRCKTMLESFLFFFLLFLLRCVRNPIFSDQVHSAKMHCERGKGLSIRRSRKTKRAFSHSIWNRIATFAHRRVQQDVQKDMRCEKETLTHRFEHCDHPDCASAIPLARLPRRVYFLSPPILPFRLLPQISNEVRKFLPHPNLLLASGNLRTWNQGFNGTCQLGLFPSFSQCSPLIFNSIFNYSLIQANEICSNQGFFFFSNFVISEICEFSQTPTFFNYKNFQFFFEKIK